MTLASPITRAAGATAANAADSKPAALAPRRIYLQGAVTSLGTGFDLALTKVTRHDAIVRLAIGDKPFDIEAGDYRDSSRALLIAPQQAFTVYPTGAAFTTLVVHLIHPRYRTIRGMLDKGVRPLEAQQYAHLIPALQEAAYGRLGVGEACDVMDEILRILLAGAKPASPIDPRIVWAMRKLDVDIDHPFEQLACELGLSPSRLSHLFTEQLGLSFRSYQTWARLRLAWEMVALRPELSLSEIAQIMGFADVAHFSRAFHKNLGLTPTVMRDARIMRILGHGLPPGQHIPSDEQMMGGR